MEKMTNEEAVYVLNLLKRQDLKINSAATDAIDMAISALKFKERYDQFWEEVKAAGMKGKETEIHHSGRVFRIREVAQ